MADLLDFIKSYRDDVDLVISELEVILGDINQSYVYLKYKDVEQDILIFYVKMLNEFDYLSIEQLNFIETFIRCRGSIKEVERELGISYPTVRAKLDEVIESLGYLSKETKGKHENNDILDALEKGEISAEEAINKLKQ